MLAIHTDIIRAHYKRLVMKEMFKLNGKSRRNIYETTGMTVEQIINMDFEDIDKHIGEKVGHKIKDYIRNDILMNRGQVYAETERFLHMNEIDKGLRKHDRRKSAFVRKTVSTV